MTSRFARCEVGVDRARRAGCGRASERLKQPHRASRPGTITTRRPGRCRAACRCGASDADHAHAPAADAHDLAERVVAPGRARAPAAAPSTATGDAAPRGRPAAGSWPLRDASAARTSRNSLRRADDARPAGAGRRARRSRCPSSSAPAARPRARGARPPRRRRASGPVVVTLAERRRAPVVSVLPGTHGEQRRAEALELADARSGARLRRAPSA